MMGDKQLILLYRTNLPWSLSRRNYYINIPPNLVRTYFMAHVNVIIINDFLLHFDSE